MTLREIQQSAGNSGKGPSWTEEFRRALVVKTIYILLTSCATELVGRCLFFANRGEFRTGDLDEIMNKRAA